MAVDIDGVEYSFDCKNCAFHRFMEMYGFDANPDTCWIDCTSEIQNNLNSVFSMILSHTYINQDGVIIYTGNIDMEGKMPS